MLRNIQRGGIKGTKGASHTRATQKLHKHAQFSLDLRKNYTKTTQKLHNGDDYIFVMPVNARFRGLWCRGASGSGPLLRRARVLAAIVLLCVLCSFFALRAGSAGRIDGCELCPRRPAIQTLAGEGNSFLGKWLRTTIPLRRPPEARGFASRPSTPSRAEGVAWGIPERRQACCGGR